MKKVLFAAALCLCGTVYAQNIPIPEQVYQALERNDLVLLEKYLKQGANPNAMYYKKGAMMEFPIWSFVRDGESKVEALSLFFKYGLTPKTRINMMFFEISAPFFMIYVMRISDTVALAKVLEKYGVSLRDTDYQEDFQQIISLNKSFSSGDAKYGLKKKDVYTWLDLPLTGGPTTYEEIKKRAGGILPHGTLAL